MTETRIADRPDGPELAELCDALVRMAPTLQSPDAWPGGQLDRCGRSGVFAWFHGRSDGGLGWSDRDVVEGYLRLAQACLTTTFVITQRAAACRRIASSANVELKERLLPDLVRGTTFATVGISHLTTSRQHVARPVLRARETAGRFVLDGFTPWVTGAAHAQHLVAGATLGDGRQLMIAVPMHLPGIEVGASARLLALSASQTAVVQFHDVAVPAECLLAEPTENIMKQGGGGQTGGIQTSTLAVGLARAALDYVESESLRRAELVEPLAALAGQWNQLRHDLVDVADGGEACSTEALRARANSLVLRASQAALTAAKGTGYVVGHPAGRWCQEALFFLVWSCPSAVLEANLCEMAGMTGDEA